MVHWLPATVASVTTTRLPGFASAGSTSVAFPPVTGNGCAALPSSDQRSSVAADGTAISMDAPGAPDVTAGTSPLAAVCSTRWGGIQDGNQRSITFQR